MVQNELTHWGIRGMKWGVRRFQNKDGSLTAAGKKRARQGAEEETPEEKKARLLKSTNADELYKNRDLLSTAEINERLNRIDTERRLAAVAEGTKKTGMDYVNKALAIGRKVDEAYKFVNESAIGKEVKKALGFTDAHDKAASKITEYMSKPIKKLTDDELKDAVTRMQREKAYNSLLKELDDATNPKTTPTKNLIGDISNLTDNQLKELNDRLDYEERVVKKLANR